MRHTIATTEAAKYWTTLSMLETQVRALFSHLMQQRTSRAIQGHQHITTSAHHPMPYLGGWVLAHICIFLCPFRAPLLPSWGSMSASLVLHNVQTMVACNDVLPKKQLQQSATTATAVIRIMAGPPVKQKLERIWRHGVARKTASFMLFLLLFRSTFSLLLLYGTILDT